ncbi:MAG: hypothetical protein H6712_04235 [Myxococcales bacterium]|nr:hypothetical protein [Myxococcales bacterium]
MIEGSRAWAVGLGLVTACAPPAAAPTGTDADASGTTQAAESTGSTASTNAADPEGSSGSGSSEGPGTGDEGSTSTSTGSSGSGSDEGSTGPGDPVEEAIERGILGASSIGNDELVMQIFLDVMYRRHSVEDFATAAARYDEIIAAIPDPPIDAFAFRRILHSSQQLTAEELAQIAPGVNEVTVPAMYCDILPLAPDYAARLQSDAALGSYELTHVVIALEWMHELGCTAPVDAAFVDQVILDDLALIEPSDGLSDLELEAAVFGTMLAGPELLPPDLVDAVLAGQLEDGTWPTLPTQTTGAWHATGVALMLLHELHREPQDGFLADTIP